MSDRNNPNPRLLSELTGENAAQRVLSVAAVPLPQVHDTAIQGLISPAIQIAAKCACQPYGANSGNPASDSG